MPDVPRTSLIRLDENVLKPLTISDIGRRLASSVESDLITTMP